MQRHQSDPVRRRASADIYGSSESTTPATQIEPEVPKVPRLPRKRPRRHISPTSSPSFRWHLWWHRKHHACHANRAWGTESATPATQKTAAPHQSYFVAKLPTTSMVVQKVPRLPRKSSLRCRKCHACHAKDRGATSLLLRRQASADIYGGTESTTPATQIEPEVLKGSRLPHKKPRASNMSPFVAKLPLTSMEVPKVPHLPRAASLRCWKGHACHTKSRGVKYVPFRRQASADIYEGTESTTPARQSEPEVLKASRLPHKKPRRQICPLSSPSFRWHLWRYRKYHACHAKRAWGAESVTPATQKAAASNMSPFVAKLPLTSMEVPKVPPWGAESVTPATQKAVASNMSPFVAKPPLTSMEVPKVPRLPRKASLKCWKGHACHTKSRGVKYVPLRRQASTDIYGGTESTTPATQSEPEVPKASRLPHKKPRRQICPPSSPSLRWHLWRHRKYHACHAKRAWSAESVTPATQKAAASNMSPFVAKLPLTSMEVPKVPPWGAESVTPATQKAVASNMSPFVAKPPLTSMEVPKVPRLPRKASLKCWKCHACHTKSRGVKYVPLRRQASTDIYGGTESTTPATQSEPEVPKASRLPRQKPRRQICPPSSPSFRWHLWRCRKYHACHAKRAWGAESVTPATQKAAASNMPPFVAKLPLTSMEVPKVPRLPRKASLKCWKRHACHTKSRGVKYVPLRRQASADIYGGAESTTPATQSEPEVLKVSRLPHKKPRRQICPPSSPSFRGHLWRY